MYVNTTVLYSDIIICWLNLNFDIVSSNRIHVVLKVSGIAIVKVSKFTSLLLKLALECFR